MGRFLAACLLMLLVGCGDKAKDLYDTAQLEEKQFNKPHATKLYRQIVEPLHYGRKFCARTTPAFSSAPISFSL